MRKQPDEVLLAKQVQCWPVELAETLLTNPAPWGPPVYAPGLGYMKDDYESPDQFAAFSKLAKCVDGAYNCHGEGFGTWMNATVEKLKAGASYEEYSTQDLLDIVFLCCRGERFSDGLIRTAEPLLRTIVQGVVKRVRSDAPPTFIVQQ